MNSSTCILLIEDDPVDVMAVRRAFKKNKVANSLYVVNDGEKALAYLRHEREFSDLEQNPRPGLILLDLKLPVMNGVEVLNALKADPDLCEIPVVVLTGSDEELDVKSSYRNGASSYLVKPTTFEKLVEAIATFDLYWTLSEVP